MGTNMQRQAVPLIESERPLVAPVPNGVRPSIPAMSFWLRSRVW